MLSNLPGEARLFFVNKLLEALSGLAPAVKVGAAVVILAGAVGSGYLMAPEASPVANPPTATSTAAAPADLSDESASTSQKAPPSVTASLPTAAVHSSEPTQTAQPSESLVALATAPASQPEAAPLPDTPAATSILWKFISGSSKFSAAYSVSGNYVPVKYSFKLSFSVTAPKAVYIPLTTGNSPSDGVNYYIAGSLQSTTSSPFTLVCAGEASVINAGGVSYCSVPAGATGIVSMSGSFSNATDTGREVVGISSVNFKVNPADITTYGYTSYTPPSAWVTTTQ